MVFMSPFTYTDPFIKRERRGMVAQPKAPMEGILSESTLRAKLDGVISSGKGLADEVREEFKERARLAIHEYKEEMSKLEGMKKPLSPDAIKSYQDLAEKTLDAKLKEIITT